MEITFQILAMAKRYRIHALFFRKIAKNRVFHLT